MNEKIRILHLEDVKTDAALVTRKLQTAKLSFEKQLVNTQTDFENALDKFDPHVILCDHSLPAFNSLEALKIVKERQLQIPFILVTGAVSEEFAVIIIKAGADDYILKDRMERLPSAITNCLLKYDAAKKTKETEERLSLTVNTLKDYAIFQLDSEGRVMSWNTAAEIIKGFKGDEIIGKHISIFYLDEDRGKGIPNENLQMARLHGRLETVGWRKRKDGSLFWADLVITALFDESGNLKGYAKITRDITERKQAEIKLRESEEKYRKIVETAQEGIWMINEHSIVTFVNSKLCNMLEYPEHEIIGKPNTFFLDNEGKKIAAQALERRKQGISENFDLSFITKSGKRIWANVSASPIIDNNKYTGALAMLTDITARKRAEHETLSLLSRIQAKNKDLRQFAYIVSHNLRAPIAKILGLASILKYSDDPTDILQKIADETMNLDNVVKDMNVIITARDGANEKTEQINFHDELKLIERVLEHNIEGSKAQITSHFDPAGILTVKGRFYSILYNLISNAIKYRSPDISLKIHVETKSIDEYICLSVRDNGRGIDLNKHGEKLFMLYQRFHGDDIPGKGIGLNLVKAQVESLGGRVEVDSEIGHGATFKIFLPKHYKCRISPQLSHVYLIDDDKLCNAIHKKMLIKQLSVDKVNVYENARVAFSDLIKISKARYDLAPDLIFLDLAMPDMDGWEFLEAFEKLPEPILEKCKIIILSSSIDDYEIKKSKTFKTVHAFLSKPLTPQKLLDLVSE